MSDNRYNGWTNYETWAVSLWMSNDEGSYDHYRRLAHIIWRDTGDKDPNPFMDHRRNAVSQLAEALQAEHDTESEHPVFKAAEGTVYADLLNAALSEVNWHEIAEHLLDDMAEQADDSDDEEEE